MSTFCWRSTFAGSPGMIRTSSPSRNPAYVYAAYKACAPVAKLMTPEARYVRTMASASAANVPPFPSPRNEEARCSTACGRVFGSVRDRRVVELDEVGRLRRRVQRCGEEAVRADRRTVGRIGLAVAT